MKIGEGCTTRWGGNPPHNPKPTTERGKRKHDARNEGQKNRAEAMWNKDRSTNRSRFQEELETNIRPTRKKNV